MMHGLVKRQGLKQECSWRVEPESCVAGVTFCVRSLEGEMGLVCMKVEEEMELYLVPLGNPTQDSLVLAS